MKHKRKFTDRGDRKERPVPRYRMLYSDLYNNTLVACILNSILAFTAVVLNVLVILALRNIYSLPRKTLKTLLLSMSVSDLGVGLVAQPLHIYLLVSNINFLSSDIFLDHHEAIFDVYRVVANVLTFASFFSIVALSTDRFLVIRLQLRYQHTVTHKRAITGVVSFWLLSAVLPLIRFLGWLPENIFFILSVTIKFISLITVGLFYLTIFLTLRQHASQVQDVPVESGERNEAVNAARERKAAFGVFYVYLAFVACNLPIICVNIAYRIGDERPILTYKLNLYTMVNLILLSSCLNPLIYCWKMRRIRKAMINMLRKPFQN